MKNHTISQSFSVRYNYPVHFTTHVFDINNDLLYHLIGSQSTTYSKKILFVIEKIIDKIYPDIGHQISNYFRANLTHVQLCIPFIVVDGGEVSKNNPDLVHELLSQINNHGIDRHSYIAVIGGGALIDVVGYAAAIAHRGVKLIRFPTTVLAQNDAAIGVKNSINYFGKKNFVGTFAPPHAVVNDDNFLSSLDIRDWRSGIAEAIKVALIKDAAFFEYIEANVQKLVSRDMNTMQQVIEKCAALHLTHIASGDPFESGSSRPLDFGHWSAHKMEQLSSYEIRHGEAVAMGMAMDAVYSHYIGWLPENVLIRILEMILGLGFEIYHEVMSTKGKDGDLAIVSGLYEFREHLGGTLTIMLLQNIGNGVETHEMEVDIIIKSIGYLKNYTAKVAI
ncbi:MAG: 3-dehydroquinate synthase [Cytophagales bacterium]|nr:3-dehydroquinate synthase [Cytophagales bacterium]